MAEQRTGTFTWVIEAGTAKETESAANFLIEKLMNVPSRLRNATVAYRIDADGVLPSTVVRGDPSPEMEALMKEEFSDEDPEVKTAV
jgi:hypothetical protein